MSETIPVVIVCASDDVTADSLIRGITKTSTPIGELEKPISECVWTIQNKYYSADVSLQALTVLECSSYTAPGPVEALIIYAQNNKGETLKDAIKRRDLLSRFDCDINILLCDICDETFPKDQATTWCIDNNFELIELLEQPEEGVDDDGPIQDYYGIDRVIQTLHTHPWTNHIPYEDLGTENNALDFDQNFDELEHMDQFCKLFSQLSSTTENAASLPSAERKAYAEQVVKAFWKAIGGDENELEDTLD